MGVFDRMEKNSMPGMFMLQDSSGMSIEFLGDKGPTVFRIFPSFTDNGKELPGRTPRDEGGSLRYVDGELSDWIYPEFGVRYAGVKGKFSAFFRTPNGSDADNTPFRHFFKVLRKEIDEDLKKGTGRFPPSWYPWVQRGIPHGDPNSPQGALAKPGWFGFVQGICYENRGKVYTNKSGQPEPKAPCVLMLTYSAVTSVETLMKEKLPGVSVCRRIEDYKIPEPVSCASGRVARFVYVPATGEGFSKYAVNMDQACPIPADLAQTMRKPWNQVLRFLTEQEQVNTLCQHFEAAAVDYALRSSQFGDLLPAEVRGSWGRKTAPVAQATATQQFQPVNTAPVEAPQFQPVNPSTTVPVAPQLSPSITAAVAQAPTIGFAPLPAAGPVGPTGPSGGGGPVGCPIGPTGVPGPVGAVNPNVPPPPPVQRPTGDADTDARNANDFRNRLLAAQQKM